MKWFRKPALIAVVFWATLVCSLSAGPGDAKLVYGTSSNLSVTSLDSAVTSATWVAGYQSIAIDNTTTTYCAIGPCLDFRVTAKVKVAAAGLSAGEIRLYLVGLLDDSTWPDTVVATQATLTWTDTEMRDAVARLCTSTVTDTGASDVYYLDCPSVAATFNGNMPAKFVIFITHSTGANLAAAGNNQVTVKGSYINVAQS